jgi:hypothetical protein
LLDSSFARHLGTSHIEAWRAARCTDLTVRIVQRRLDADAASLAQRL